MDKQEIKEKQHKIKILVACHKADPNIRHDEIYMPIHVGKALNPKLDLGYQGDNSGENISEKNPFYCELTALYWGWKNLPDDVEYVGLAHYRRYLDIRNNKITDYLKNCDILLPRPEKSPFSNFINLVSFIGFEDTYILIDTLLDLYPEMKKDIINYFFNSNKYSVYNMLITNKNIFNEYNQFLFNVLELTERKIKKIENYTRINRRIGYMGEALLGLWILHKKLKVKYLSIHINDSPKLNWKGRIGLRLKKILSNISFLIQRYPLVKEIPYWNAVLTGLKADNIYLQNIS